MKEQTIEGNVLHEMDKKSNEVINEEPDHLSNRHLVLIHEDAEGDDLQDDEQPV